ncbi:MAG: ion transporter [Pseudonocardia sp.]|nr:ion transporter [Pseudonocardia sp.]
MIGASRDSVRRLVDHPRFQQTIIVVIVLNAITLGAETFPTMVAHIGSLLNFLDYAALSIFVVEISLRIYAHGWQFFRDPWSVFDFLVVAIALVPASESFSVLRALRILRVLRLVSMVPSMRRVVNGLLAAVPGMTSIAALLALIIYVAGVMATKLFADVSPQYFGSLGTTLFTMFQIMTGENWPDIARGVMEQQPLAWIFFVVYILITTFAVLNLFIAVVVSAMDHEVVAEVRAEDAEHAAEEQAALQTVLMELRQLRAEVAASRGSGSG